MENLIEALRLATLTEATDEARATGAQACRTLLLALDAKPGEPLAAPASAVEGAVEVEGVARESIRRESCRGG